MGFADAVNTTLFNSILVPTHFGSSGNDIKQRTFGKDLTVVNTWMQSNLGSGGMFDCMYNVKLKLGNDEYPLKQAISVGPISIARPVTKQMYWDYTVNVPGQMSFSPITIKYNYTKDSFLLNWLTAGLDNGGSYSADLILVATVANKVLTFTLQDLHVLSWELTTNVATSLDTSVEIANPLLEVLTCQYSGIHVDVKEST